MVVGKTSAFWISYVFMLIAFGSQLFSLSQAGKSLDVETVFFGIPLVSFSVFNYAPIRLITSSGQQLIDVPNPSYVQLPLIREVIHDLQGFGKCRCTSVSATPVNWVMDRILGKF